MGIFTELTQIREVTYFAVILRILAAAVLGGFMGLERGLKNRAAGLRTYMLVCVGACLIMLTNQFIYQAYGQGDPVRMGAQVISGIGFLGAGTIIVTRRSQIKGLTTAAGLWSAAGVGLALGVGFYEAAVVGALAIFVVMALLQRMDDRMHRKSRTMEVYLEMSPAVSLGDFLRQIRAMEIEVGDIQREHEPDTDEEVRAYVIVMRTKKRRNHAEVLEEIRAIPGIGYLEEL